MFGPPRLLPLTAVGVVLRPTVLDRQDAGRDTVEKVAVVGHQDQRPGELEQALLEHLEGRDVEIVGRLVEDQQVGRLQHQPGDQNPRLLAAGEAPHRRVELLGAEEEALRPGGDVHDFAQMDHRIAVGRERAPQGELAIERLSPLLETEDLEERRALDLAAVGQEAAVEEREEGRLAAAVQAEEAEPGARAEQQVDAGEDGAAVERLGEPGRFEEPLRAPARGLEVDAGARAGGAAADVGELAQEVVGAVDARFRFRGARLRTAAQPVDLDPRPVGERLLVVLLVLEHLVALDQEVAVGAVDGEDPLRIDAVELEHPARDVLEEVAVVGDHHERLRGFHQQLLELEDPFEVEMVGRLVEEQQVGLAGDLAGDRQALLPAAGEGADRELALAAIAEAEPAEGARGARLLLVLLERLAGERLDHHLLGGRLGREAGVLLDVADPDPLAERELPVVGLEAPGEDAQQRRLAGAVGADEPHPVALKEAKRKILEQRAGTELVRHPLTREQQRAGGRTDGHKALSRETTSGAAGYWRKNLDATRR